MKIIVGRTLQDNTAILNHYDPIRDVVIKTIKIPAHRTDTTRGQPGPIGQAASICAGSGEAPEVPVAVEVISPGNINTLWVTGMRTDCVQSMLIG